MDTNQRFKYIISYKNGKTQSSEHWEKSYVLKIVGDILTNEGLMNNIKSVTIERDE